MHAYGRGAVGKVPKPTTPDNWMAEDWLECEARYADAARAVIEVFSEVIIASDYEDEALEIFKSKKNLRLLRIAKSAIRDRTTQAQAFR